MTLSEMFREAHKQAKLDRRFHDNYQQAFACALRGFWAVAKGFRGIEIVEPRRLWA